MNTPSLSIAVLRGLLVLAFAACAAVAAGEVLIPAGAVWKYFPVSNDVGSVWRELEFDDSSWPGGPAQLGYGDQDEVTWIPFYFDGQGGKNISTYFRHAFAVTNAANDSNLTLRVLRDDGAVVYLNGIEVFRSNMPTGEVTYTTTALTSLSAPEENYVFVSTNITAAALREGVNVLAVEIHQHSPGSQDISFDLELATEGSRTRPGLRHSMTAGLLRLSWPSWGADFRLYSTESLASPVSWSAVTNGMRWLGVEWHVDVPMGSTVGSRYFRLEAP